MSIIDHIGIRVSDYARSKAFYEAALAPLGITVVMEVPPEHGGPYAGLGRDGKPEFWFGAGPIAPTLHVAFSAASRADVDAFYEAAIAAGGADHGAPGERPQYRPGYYGAFVLDPDGYNVEAVCHG